MLGITGGIAAYKAAELTRLLVKQGIAVRRRDDVRSDAVHYADDPAGAFGHAGVD